MMNFNLSFNCNSHPQLHQLIINNSLPCYLLLNCWGMSLFSRSVLFIFVGRRLDMLSNHAKTCQAAAYAVIKIHQTLNNH